MYPQYKDIGSIPVWTTRVINMQRQYKIGDTITVRGIRYEVRSQREYPYFDYCDHCSFGVNKKHCILRLRYRHFLEDCSSVRAYFKRV